MKQLQSSSFLEVLSDFTQSTFVYVFIVRHYAGPGSAAVSVFDRSQSRCVGIFRTAAIRRFFVWFKRTKHYSLDWEKIFPTPPWFWKSAEKWRRIARSKLPVLAGDRPVQKKKKKGCRFADLFLLVGEGGSSEPPNTPSYAHGLWIAERFS